jgi:hypothetical protein
MSYSVPSSNRTSLSAERQGSGWDHVCEALVAVEGGEGAAACGGVKSRESAGVPGGWGEIEERRSRAEIGFSPELCLAELVFTSICAGRGVVWVESPSAIAAHPAFEENPIRRAAKCTAFEFLLQSPCVDALGFAVGIADVGLIFPRARSED